jgi:hypothetical protein
MDIEGRLWRPSFLWLFVFVRSSFLHFPQIIRAAPDRSSPYYNYLFKLFLTLRLI